MTETLLLDEQQQTGLVVPVKMSGHTYPITKEAKEK
jgi:hypothetical protein